MRISKPVTLGLAHYLWCEESWTQLHAWKFSTFVGREGQNPMWICAAAKPCSGCVWAVVVHLQLSRAGPGVHCTWPCFAGAVLLVPDLTLHLESICCPLLTVFCDPYFFMAGIIWKSSTLAVFIAPYSTLYSSEQLPFVFNLSRSNYFKCPQVKH